MPRFAEEWRRSTLGHPLTTGSKDSPNPPSASTERVASKRVTLKLLRPNKT